MARCAGLLLLVCLSASPAARAQDRLVRRFAGEQGLEAPPVSALAQDTTGFLWIGTQGGLYRYDGIEFRGWGQDRIVGGVVALGAARDGRIAGQMQSGGVFEITGDATARIPPPAIGWAARTRTLAYDERGRLWAVGSHDGLVYRDGGAWTVIPRQRLGGERVHGVRPAAERGILALTDGGLWHVEAPGSRPRKRFDTPLWDALSLADGRLLLLTYFGRVVELNGSRVRTLASAEAGELPRARPIAIAERNGTIWVSFDHYLASIRPGREPEVIGPEDGVESGGPLLVDREGSLWLGAFAALFQYPEPETTLWNGRHGLPGRHTRFVARSGDVIWVTAWQGTGRLRTTGTGITASVIRELYSRSRPCTDSLGVVWLSTADAVVRLRGSREVGRLPRVGGFNSCAATPGPGLWIGGAGLFHADAVHGTLRRIGGLPFGEDDAVLHAVYQDRRGRVWIARFERVCHAPATAVLAGRDAGWVCETVDGIGNFTEFVALPDGTLWGATRQAAVLARDEGGWHPIPATADLASRDVYALVPSRSGGIWVTGHGILVRVRPGGPDGWEVLESLSPGNGLTSVGGADLVEDADGTLWITTSLGLLRVPPHARFARLDPPRVVLVDARVDTDPVPLHTPLVLPADRNRLELRFAALSFREPGRIRYQVRLSPDAPWVGTRGQPSFVWVDLPPGRYRAVVRASLDGRHWSEAPARFAFRVLPPWYRTPWALALFAALAGAVLWALYHARLMFLLGLERQRTRIAMDLHDELGSGLGSIGILAGLLAGRWLDDAQRSRIAGEVAGTAEELGNALADIVWSLDRRAATLEELASRLAAHGERLFAGDDVAFRVRSPREWPDVRLPLRLRRNVLLIGLEALHNAARHANARQVSLTFARDGARWRLTVRDDGVGLGGGEPCDARRGRGLVGMRRRAAEIGADIAWGENPDGGTTVTLQFAIHGRAIQRVRIWLGRHRRRRWHDHAGARSRRGPASYADAE